MKQYIKDALWANPDAQVAKYARAMLTQDKSVASFNIHVAEAPEVPEGPFVASIAVKYTDGSQECHSAALVNDGPERTTTTMIIPARQS